MGKKWEKRGFMLADGVLSYYDTELPPSDPSAFPARGSINLRTVSCYLQTKMPIDASPTPFTMELVPTGEKHERWKMCADTSADFDQWVKAIEVYASQSQAGINPASYLSDDETSVNPRDDIPITTPSGDSDSATRAASPRPGARSTSSPPSSLPSSNPRPLPVPASAAKPPAKVAATTTTATPVAVPAVTAVSSAPANAKPSGHKKRGGLKLSRGSESSSNVMEMVAVAMVVNTCMIGCAGASSWLLSVFYVLVCNAVVITTMSLHAGRVRDASTAAAHVTAVPLSSSKHDEMMPRKSESIPGASAPPSSSSESKADDAAADASGEFIVPLRNGKPIAGCSFEQVFTHAPHVPEHTWCKCLHSQFQVRIGPDYNRHKKKAPSSVPLYEPFAVDVIWYAPPLPLLHTQR